MKHFVGNTTYTCGDCNHL